MSNDSLNKIPGLSESEVQAVKLIISSHLLPDQEVDVWLFGSRATGRFRKYSDVDLLVEPKSKRNISSEQIARMREDFEDSELPFKFDIILQDDLAKEFAQSVELSKKLVFYKLSGSENANHSQDIGS